MLRHPTEFLPTVTQANARPSAGAESEHRLVRLIARAGLRFFRIQPRVDAFHADRIERDGYSQTDDCCKYRRKKILPANSRDQQHPRTDTKQEQSGAVIASRQN